MTQEEILQRLQEIFRDILDNDTLVLTPEATAGSVRGWDSEAHLRLMIATEAAFAIRFEVKEITSLSNVGSLVHLIHRKLG